MDNDSGDDSGLVTLSNDELVLQIARSSFKKINLRGASPRKVHDRVGDELRVALLERDLDKKAVNARISAIFDHFQQGILTGVCREDAFEAALVKAQSEIIFPE